MRFLYISCLLLVNLQLHSQNVFSDGVREVKTIDYKDGSYKYALYGFKLIMDDNCAATYSYNQVITNSVMITSNLSTISWNWKNIASLEQDTVNHILRLNGRENMSCTDKDLDTKETSTCQMNDMVNVYFKTNVALRMAIDWVLQKVKDCDGKAWLIN